MVDSLLGDHIIFAGKFSKLLLSEFHYVCLKFFVCLWIHKNLPIYSIASGDSKHIFLKKTDRNHEPECIFSR